MFVPVYNYSLLGTSDPRGQWTVSPPAVERSFEIVLTESDLYHVERISGVYQTVITDTLLSLLTTGDTFWEVGGGWGYFSLLVAPTAGQVVAFEPIAERAASIRTASDANGYQNVTVAEVTVDRDSSVTEYPAPDLVLMDTDGGEYEAVPALLDRLDVRPIWLVEVHEPESDVPTALLPERVRSGEQSGRAHLVECFREHGYETTVVDERSSVNSHLLATQASTR